MERLIAGEAEDGPAHAVLRGHRDLLRWQTISERMTVALKALTGVAGVGLAAALIVLIWSASRYQGLVVQPLVVPPDIAERGLTGEVMAGDLLDRLVSMQERTESVRAPGSYAIDWGDSTQVEIPQTGVSIGELQRYLRTWLGKETRISGVVYRTRDGRLAVTARTGGTAGVTFTGTEDELESLMQKAAEAVYARTQPYRYTVFLGNSDRSEEAVAVYETAASYGPPESLWLTRGWGIRKMQQGDVAGALALYRQVEAQAPEMGPLWQTIADAEGFLGHAEASHQARVRASELIERSSEVDPLIRRNYAANERARAALSLGDVRLADELSEQALADGRFFAGQHPPQVHFAAHRIEAAVEVLETTATDFGSVVDGIATLSARIALWAGDPTGALGNLDAADALMMASGWVDQIPAMTGPVRVSALIGLGRTAEARRLAASLPRDCYDCLLARAEAAEAVGDRTGGDYWFGRAVGNAPSLPLASYRWGEALLARGDPAGAIVRFREAVKRGPAWGDPLKGWGDALMALGDRRAAIGKYSAAAERAPGWGQLHLAWGRALESSGRRVEAVERYRSAARLDLNPADRAEVVRRLAAVSRGA